MKKALIPTLAIAGLLATTIAFAETSTTTSTSTATTTVTSVDIVCMQTAVDKRETSMINGMDAYSTAIKSALTIRKDALKAAWTNTDKTARRTAIKSAWETYKASRKTAMSDWKSAKKSAWSTFQTEAKACKNSASYSLDMSNKGLDTSL